MMPLEEQRAALAIADAANGFKERGKFRLLSAVQHRSSLTPGIDVNSGTR